MHATVRERIIAWVFLLALAIRQQAYHLAGLGICLLIVTGLIGVSRSPTIKSKFDYMRYDLQQLKEKNLSDNQYSDTRRVLTDRLGWELFRAHPIAGVGIGDLPGEIEKIYTTRYPDFPPETRGHIHNQYLLVLAGGGIVLGLLFLLAIWWPVWYYFRNGDDLLGTASLLLALVLLWEPFLQYQYGNTIYLLLLIFGTQLKRDAA